jgi:hypothetical protein
LRIDLIRLIRHCASRAWEETTARPGSNPRLQFKRPLYGSSAPGLELTSRILKTKDANLYRIRACPKTRDLIAAIFVCAGYNFLVALSHRDGSTGDRLVARLYDAGLGGQAQSKGEQRER